MKTATIGSRNLKIENLERYIDSETDEIVSGGADGIDSCAKIFAEQNGIKYTEFTPEYARYGRAAPLKRNLEIISYSDCVLTFWDGESRGTKYVIEKCRELGKMVEIHIIKSRRQV